MADLIESVTPLRQVGSMEKKVWTAAELDAMTPAAPKKIFDELDSR